MSNLKDFTIKNGVLTKYKGADTNVIIPDGVASIGDKAFFYCRNLESIALPDGVTTIGKYAFYGCENLTSITIPDGVTSIGEKAFSYCESLTSVEMPDSVKNIGGCAFSDCKNLTHIKIPDSVTSIGKCVFMGCAGLANEDGFVVLRGMLRYCYSTADSITLPDNVTSIEGHVFRDCVNRTSITIPNSVNQIDKDAFGQKNMRILIEDFSALPIKFRPQTVLAYIKHGDYFSQEHKEKCIKYVEKNAGKWISSLIADPDLLAKVCEEKAISAKDASLCMEAAQASGSTEAVALLLDYTANGLTAGEKQKVEKQKEKDERIVMERLVLRQGKEGIDGLIFSVASGMKTFQNREELKSFIVSKGGKFTSTVSAKVDFLIMNDDSVDSTKKQKAEELGIEVITECQFNEKACRIFDIEDCTLKRYYGSEVDVVIPEGVTSIGDGAFEGCETLTDINIPDSVTNIGEGAFKGCTGLADADGFVLVRGVLYDYCGTADDITVPAGVTGIGRSAFADSEYLTSINIPDGVTSIGSEAFRNCYELEDITLPDSVMSIGEGAFKACENLISITIPAGVTRIERSTFEHCSMLTNVIIPDSVTSIGESAFKGCAGLADAHDFVVVRGVLYDYCGGKGKVKVPAGVTSISEHAFYGRKKLTDIIIPDSVTRIECGAFAGCKNITIHASSGSCAEKYAQTNGIPFTVK